MNMTIRMPGAAAALAAAVVGLAGCHGTGSLNKAGAVRPAVTVIRLQMPDNDEGYGSYFAQAAARYSRGTLRVVVDVSGYPSRVPANEARLVAALRAGRVGFSFQPARDWAAAGLSGFEALDTPFLVTTVRASDLLAASPVAAALLRELSPLGLVGLGMVPSEPRQILSTRPLIAPAAFQGIRVRITDNSETAALMKAIGSRPVQGLAAQQVGVLLRSGSLTGVENGPYYISSNSYNAEAHYLTSYALFPKFETLVATRQAWLALTPAQRTAVRQAIAATLGRAHTALPGNEGQDLARLCTNGVILDEPSPAQLAALAREAGGPTANAEVAATFRMIRADVPGTGPQLSPIPVPTPCRTAQTLAQAISLHRLGLPARSSRQGATIRPGNYATTVTVADLRAGGVYGADWNKPITYTYHMHADGKVEQTQVPDYPDQGPIYGHYVVHGDEVTFIWNAASGLTPEKLRWSYFRGQLTFGIISVQDSTGQVQYVAHPWHKVG
jgi:TRAP-type C4-dicarboxylate transport system substrate-binding protein